MSAQGWAFFVRSGGLSGSGGGFLPGNCPMGSQNGGILGLKRAGFPAFSTLKPADCSLKTAFSRLKIARLLGLLLTKTGSHVGFFPLVSPVFRAFMGFSGTKKGLPPLVCLACLLTLCGCVVSIWVYGGYKQSRYMPVYKSLASDKAATQ